MGKLCIHPTPLSGRVTIPPSKSAAHRAIICASLACGISRITNISLSDDIAATIGAMRALGAVIKEDGNRLTIDGSHTLKTSAAVIDCIESGSTLRFLIPIAAAGGIHATFTGRGRLPQRPIGIYTDCLPAHGITCETAGGLPLTTSGTLQPGRFSLRGDVSSQFITGLLLALPLLCGDSEIVLTTPLESKPYVDMTLATQRAFGIQIEQTEQGFIVPGNQRYRACDYRVEGDYSQAAFFLMAGAMGSAICCCGLSEQSTQGDQACIPLCTAFGGQVSWKDGDLCAVPGKLHGIEIDAMDIPDLVPALAVCASVADGTTRIYNAARLRIKESDRIEAVCNMLTCLGGCARQTDDGLLITGVSQLRGGTVDACGDHRIAMAAAIAATRCTDDVLIDGYESVRKSYPNFFEDYQTLGGRWDVVNMG